MRAAPWAWQGSPLQRSSSGQSTPHERWGHGHTYTVQQGKTRVKSMESSWSLVLHKMLDIEQSGELLDGDVDGPGAEQWVFWMQPGTLQSGDSGQGQSFFLKRGWWKASIHSGPDTDLYIYTVQCKVQKFLHLYSLPEGGSSCKYFGVLIRHWLGHIGNVLLH